MTRDGQTRIQEEYARLEQEKLGWRHRELWRLAERNVRAQMVSEIKASHVVRKRSGLAVAGFFLMCVATPLTMGSLMMLFAEDGFSDPPFLVWVVASILGIVALAMLVTARTRIRRSYGEVTGEGLVYVGFAIAAPGAVASFLMFNLAALWSSGL